MNKYLAADDIIDFEAPDVKSLAESLRAEGDAVLTASRCFHWVRDRIRHSIDHSDRMVTVTASEVLRHGTGLCYAKSHLLAALLRANGIPCGFVYQRLALDETGQFFSLHGLNAVLLPGPGWYRVDPRGNREGLVTDFTPPHEHLAFPVTLPGERTFPEVFSEPLPVVISALRRHRNLDELCANLPDFS